MLIAKFGEIEKKKIFDLQKLCLKELNTLLLLCCNISIQIYHDQSVLFTIISYQEAVF